MKLICYKKCSTCKSVEKLLKENEIEYEYREIDKENPNVEEIKEMHEKSGLDIKKFFNTSGAIYREKKLKDKLDKMSLQDKYDILATDGMIVKRPILLDGNKILVGPQVKNLLKEE